MKPIQSRLRSSTTILLWQVVVLMIVHTSNHHRRTGTILVEAFTVQNVARTLIESAVAQSPRFAAMTIGTTSASNHKISLKASTMDETTTSTSSISNNQNETTIVDAMIGNNTAVMTVVNDDEEERLLRQQIEAQAALIADEMMEETCEIDTQTGNATEEICINENQRIGFRNTLKSYIRKIEYLILGKEEDAAPSKADDVEIKKPLTGDDLEQGWERRANLSALRRNAEVWKFAVSCALKVLKPRKMAKNGEAPEKIKAAQIEAAEYIRDGLLELGPSFVKLGQVLSTRTDVLPAAYTDTLKTLTDEVPGFDGRRAKDIVSQELGRPCDEIFQNFSAEPLKAASLGQVHTAMYKGKKVAIKVQRAGLKELFDIDLKNLRKLAVLLEKFDPKSDGADRDWVSIYEESERLLYLEIDYFNEVKNLQRFANDFREYDWVKIPSVYREVTTSRVLTMEFVESFKLTDVKQVEKYGLDRKVLAKRVADSFLRQIIETAFFHADPHSGNLCVNKEGQLVFYDFGQMDELKPNVRKGLRTFCTALFAGGPMISDTELARNAKDLVLGAEQAGVISKNADRLAIEKLARFFMRAFKDKQLGKKSGNIKETIGPDLQTLTDNNSFRFPTTFTFVFRAFVSIEGIGKELDSDFDIGKLSQPFVEKFIDSQNGYSTDFEKNVAKFQKATGLTLPDISTAVMQPKKVAYIEETLRAMESGSLKIRVRSLENEKALERMALRQGLLENLVLSAVAFNVASLLGRSSARFLGVGGACFFLFQALMANAKIKKFDKKQQQYISSDFQDANIEGEGI